MKPFCYLITISLTAVLFLLAGCNGEKNSPLTPGGKASTSASLTITWPERARLVPLAAESITVAVAGPYGFTAAQTVDRPVTGNTTSVSFPSVPVGQLTFTASAYPQAGGQGTAQATATVTQTGQANAPIHVTLTMASTITTIVLTPATPRVPLHSTMQLDVTAKNAASNVVLLALNDLTWRSSNTSVATVVNGLITTVAKGTATITATYGTVSAQAILTVTDPNTDAPTAVFTLSPASGDVTTNFQFNASACNDTQDEAVLLPVRWDWEGDGTYDTSYSLLKTAQHRYTTAGVYTARLQVKDSGGWTAIAEKTVVVKVFMSVSPTTARLLYGEQQTFTAQVQGSTQTGVTWSVQESNGGAITTNGVYTAPSTSGIYHAVATSVADATVSVSIPVVVHGETNGTVVVH